MCSAAHHIHLYTGSILYNLRKASNDNLTVCTLNVCTIPDIVGGSQRGYVCVNYQRGVRNCLVFAQDMLQLISRY